MSEQKIERPWKCKNGHVLGQLERVRGVKNGVPYRATRLNVFRHAIDLGAEMPAEVDVMMVLPAYSGTPGIVCDVCGVRRPWDINQELLDKLIASTRKGRK